MSQLIPGNININPFALDGLSFSPADLIGFNSEYQGDIFLGLDWKSSGFSSPSIEAGLVKAGVKASNLSAKLGVTASFGLGLGEFTPSGNINVFGRAGTESITFAINAGDSALSIKTPYGFSSLSLEAGASGSVGLDGVARIPRFGFPPYRDEPFNTGVSIQELSSTNLFEVDSRMQQSLAYSVSPFNFTFTFPNFSGLSTSPQSTPNALSDNSLWQSARTEERVVGFGSKSNLFNTQLSLGESLMYLGLPPTAFNFNAGPVGIRGTLIDAVTNVGLDLDWNLAGGMRPNAFIRIEGVSDPITLNSTKVTVEGFSDLNGDGLISGRIRIDPIIGFALNANLIPQASASIKAIEAGINFPLGFSQGIGPLFNQGIGIDIAKVNFADLGSATYLSSISPGSVLVQDFAIPLA